MKCLSIKKSLVIMTLTIAIALQTQAQQTVHKMILDKMNYLLYLPEEYETNTKKQFPLMLFLHGAGECGDDIEKVKTHGPPLKIVNGYKYPFIVVSPQSPERGWKPDFILRLVLDLQKNYRIDKERTYLTGLSMGGFGTWRTAQTYPQLFAAIIPVCGGGNSQNIWTLKNMPIWCFHGAKDDIVDISYSQIMIDSLKNYNNPNVKFTIYPESKHDSWTETYNNEEVYKWMLSHKRFKYEEKPVTADALNEYVGEYSSPILGSIRLIVRDKQLVMEREKSPPTVCKFAGNDKFFFASDSFENLKFNRNENNAIVGFIYIYTQFKIDFKKQAAN